jgi:hypothetical protein
MLPSSMVLELLEWIGETGRSYPETIEAWGSRCPRHTPWEDAIAAGLIRLERRGTVTQAVVVLTERGHECLRNR